MGPIYLSSSFFSFWVLHFFFVKWILFFQKFSLKKNMYLISIFIILSIFWDMSSYISDGGIIVMYTMTLTMWSIKASTMAFTFFRFSRIAVLCSCFKTAGGPQPSSISWLSCSSSSWCHTTIEPSPSRFHFASIIFVVSQLLFSRRAVTFVHLYCNLQLVQKA